MFANKSKHKSKQTSSARVVDGKMILACPQALNPVLWQMDLAQARASALEIQSATHKEGELTTGESFLLVLKNPKGESMEVARFALREHALDALMAAAHALENAHGHIRASTPGEVLHLDPTQAALMQASAANAYHAPRKSVWPGILMAILGLLLLVGILSFLSPRPPVSIETAPAGAGTDSQASQPAPSGVPLSADEFLNTR